MKVFKESGYSLYPRPLAIDGKFYLSLGILAFYDLNDPASLLTEQALWQTLPELLGEPPIIDQGVPKPRGEFLITGSCFAPNGETRSASEVSVQVGSVKKTLNIYGNRYWKNGLISPAEAFSEIPLIWQNSFGGKEFAPNPLGKGIDKVQLADGSEAIALPNIESPLELIGSPAQEVKPAGLAPLDMMWPQRFSKNGTYDDKWKRERWPYFPDDMNYEFFNMASEDQFIDGFFQGGESLVIKNMHSEQPVIESALPNQRVRCFVTLDPNFKLHQFPVAELPSSQLSGSDEFHEVETHLETVWLFPGIMRGLVIYRGMIEIQDEDRGDVLRVLIRDEKQGEAPKPIEYYRDLQAKLLDRGVDIDMSPFEEAMKNANKALLKINNIPKSVDEVRQAALGNRPVKPMPEPEEMLAKSKKMLAGQHQVLDKLETMAQKAYAQHGHRAEINLGVFDSLRTTMASISQNIERATQDLSRSKKAILDDTKSSVQQTRDKLKAIKPDVLAKAGVDPDEVLPDNFPFNQKVDPWHDRGFPYVVACRKSLEDDKQTMSMLTALGLDEDTIDRYWLGVSHKAQSELVQSWGIEGEEEFTLPVGIWVPRFDGPVLTRIQCYSNYAEGGEPFLVPESDATPLFIPSATLIDLPSLIVAEQAPVICVADELQALFMEQEVGDCCSILALRDPSEQLSDKAAAAFDQSQYVLVVRPTNWQQDNDLKQEWSEWLTLHAQIWPIELECGQTVFGSHGKGKDIRQWIFEHLPKEYVAHYQVGATLPAKGKSPDKDAIKGFMPPFPDIGALTSAVYDEVKQKINADFAPLLAEKDQLLADTQQKIAKYEQYGVDPAKLSLDKPVTVEESFSDAGQKAAADIRHRAADLDQKGLLTKELAEKFENGAKKVASLGVESEALKGRLTKKYKVMKQDLDEGLEKLKNRTLPKGLAESLKQQGLDPDAVKVMGREEVLERYQQGKSMAGSILSGVDLSELELIGIDLSRCQLKNTSFKNSRLDNALFCRAMGTGTDFTGASLKQANFTQAMLNEAVFKGCDLSEMQGKSVSFNGADFSDACLVNINLKMAMLNETDFTGADLTGSRLYMVMLSGKADKVCLRHASISKCIFTEFSLTEADLSHATVNETQFQGGGGDKVIFTAADLTKMSSMRNARFTHSDFNRAVMHYVTLRETDFSGSTFNKTDLENGLFEHSKLTQCNFTNAYAKGVKFSKCNLEGSIMRACNIMLGSMRKTRLVDVDLRGSNLFAVDFYQAVLGHTRFEGANLKRSQLHTRLDLLEQDNE